jgi:hypothetical protein
MKLWMFAPCMLLATMLAAQTSSPTETDLPPNAPAQADTAKPSPASPLQSAPAAVPSAPLTGTLPVPAGTALMVRLDTTLATFSNRVGDPFQGHITQPVVVNGSTVIPAGATIEGRVTKVSEPRRIAGRPTIGILPEDVILPNGERYFLDATLTDTNIPGSDVNSEGQFKGSGHDRRDQLEVGGGTAGGMLIGGLVGGPVGVLVGGVIGAGSGTGFWLGKHRSATLPAGTQLTLELNRPLTMATQAANTQAANGGSN